jgi:ribosome-associated toxin RatA of RatAB toxin-antitoxin module
MAKLSDSASTDIDAPIDAVWPIVEDVAGWPEWQGSLGSLDILERDGDGRASLCAVEFDAKMTKIKMKLACSYSAPTRMSFERKSGDLSHLAGSWTLEDLGDGRTRATYTLDSDPGRVLGMLIRGPVEGAIRGMLVNARPDELKARVEDGRVNP